MGKYNRNIKKLRKMLAQERRELVNIDPDLCFDIGAGESFTGTIFIKCSPDMTIKKGTVLPQDSILRARVKKWNGVEPKKPSSIFDLILNMVFTPNGYPRNGFSETMNIPWTI